MLLQIRSHLQSKTKRALLEGTLSTVAARNESMPSTSYVGLRDVCENHRECFECRGKRGGPLSSANPVGSLLCFALFAFAFGDFAFAFCLAFTLSRILGRYLFCIAFAFIFGLGLLRVAFTLIFGLYFLVFAFALSITLLLVGSRLLFVTHLISSGRICHRS